MKKLFLSSLYVNVFVRFINVWTGVLSARFLGPYGRGELAAANRWTSLFVLLFTIGLPGAVIFYGKQRREKQAEYIGAYLVLGSALGLMGFIVGEAMVPHLFFKQPQYLVHMAMIAMMSVPFGVVADGLVGTLLTLNMFSKVLGIRVLGEVGTLVLVLGLLILGKYTVKSFIIGNIAWSVLVFILTLLFIIRAVKPKFTCLIGNIKSLFAKGVHIYSAALVSMFGTNIDQLVISLFLNPYTLGLYAVSSTIGGILPAIISSALSAYLWPKLMDFDEQERQRRVARIHGVLFYGTLLVSIASAAAIPILLPLVYGRDFHSAVVMTEIMLMSTPINVGYLVITYFLSTSNKFTTITVAEVLGLALGLVVTLPLIHLWSGAGAAIGVFVATLSKWIYAIIVARRLGLSIPNLMNLYPSSFVSLYQHLISRFRSTPVTVK